MASIQPKEYDYTECDKIAEQASLTSKREERERLQSEIEAFLNSGGRIEQVRISTTSVEIKTVGEIVAQRRAAALRRRQKGALTDRQAKAREYIDRRGECTLNDLKLYLGTTATSARKTAQSLEIKRCIRIEGDTFIGGAGEL